MSAVLSDASVTVSETLPEPLGSVLLTPIARQDIYHNFHFTVNMTATEIDGWLANQASQAATGIGDEPERGIAREIIRLKLTPRDELTDTHYFQMLRITERYSDLMGRPPRDEPDFSQWCDALMSCGHNPFKKDLT